MSKVKVYAAAILYDNKLINWKAATSSPILEQGLSNLKVSIILFGMIYCHPGIKIGSFTLNSLGLILTNSGF